MIPTKPEDLQLPDVLIFQYRTIVDANADGHWADGDFLADVVDEFTTVYPPEEMRRVRARIIAQLANATGANRSTMRQRELMSRFFTPDLRREYQPLTWYQLRECRRAGDAWEKWAVWALDHLPAPCHVIRNAIKSNGDLPPAWVEMWERLGDLARDLSNNKDIDQDARLKADLAHKIITGELTYEADCGCSVCRYARGV
jgi:hypothetical protein